MDTGVLKDIIRGAQMMKNMPAGAAILLDFIGNKEAQDRYDAVYGNHQQGFSKPITTMTIDELAALQSVLGRKYGSSASGRYQFLASTMSALRKALKLTGKEVFTPDLQDRLAFQLLKQRGYARFKAGSITPETFARNIAMEWASMPVLVRCQGAHRVVAAGETYYAGDRLNKALVSTDEFRVALGRAAATKA